MQYKRWKIPAKRFFLRTASKAQRSVERYIGFILGLFLFNYFTIFWSLYHTYQLEQIHILLLDGIFLFAGIVLYAILIDMLPFYRLRRFFVYLSFLLSGLLWGMEVFSIYNYGSLAGAGVLTAMLETNPQEAREFLLMYVGWKGLLAFLAFLLTVYGTHRYIFSRGLPLPRRMQNRLVLLVLLTGTVSGTVLWNSCKPFIINHSLDIPALQVYNAAQIAAKNLRAYENLEEKMANDLQLTENKSTIPNIVCILGESTNRHHMHLYGYALENTPNLDNMQKKGELAVFTDCVSPHSTTVAVLRELFTFHDAESEQEWYTYNNLIDVMNTAGYKTHWLSNQESSGIWGNAAQLFARRSQVHDFTRMRESHEDFGSLDEELFPMLDDALLQAGEKNFYVLHLMGEHSLYYMRFPYIFSKFTKDDIHRDLSEEQRTEIAQYDNAIYYNDYIVSGIIDKFRDTNTLLIFLPDHGETLFANGSSFAGHVEENPNHYMLEIPMIFWASDSFKSAYPQKWAAIRGAVDRPYMTDDIIHTLLDLADIHTMEYDTSKSIVNPAFDASRLRMIQGRDYDTEIRNDAEE
jgi:heptose-I-phosphate ethanolaminephosphotransferase